MISTETHFAQPLIDNAWFSDDLGLELDQTVQGGEETESKNLGSAGEIVIFEASLTTILELEDCLTQRVINSNGNLQTKPQRFQVCFR